MEEKNHFEAFKARQEASQAETLRKAGKTARLPHELADAAHALAAKFVAKEGAAVKTACEEGCSYCCHQPATVFPFEAIRIARVLKESLSNERLEALEEKMKSRVKGLKGASVRKNINDKTACPLLVDDCCSIYANRPLTCRLAHSFSVKRCRVSFQKDRTKVEIPISLELLTGISGIIEGAFERLPEKGLDANLYELCSAVLAALADPDAAAKWAKGDRRVFEGCVRDDT
ncbi:MAG: YkgJ family cysteine cluster protein [Deltaproteobacteria bacterium]|nr:YkgJ family cysteine cluster protein [Deltaproteobacteria bacterium]